MAHSKTISLSPRALKLLTLYIGILILALLYGYLGAFKSMRSIAIFVGFPLIFSVVFLRAWYGLILVVAISPIFSFRVDIGFANMWVHQWIILTTGAAVLVRALLAKTLLTHSKTRLNILILTFWIFLFLSIQAAQGLPNSLMFKYVLYYGVFFSAFYITLLAVYDWKIIDLTIIFLCIATIIACVFAQFITPRLAGTKERLYSFALLDNPNSLGNYLAIVVAFLTAYFVMARQKAWIMTLIIITIVISTLSLIGTQSRSSWLGLSGSLIVLFMFRPKVLLVLAALIGIAFYIGGLEAVEKRAFEKTASVEYRIRKAEYAVKEMFPRRPIIGNGPGSFEYEISKHTETTGDIIGSHSSLENQYLLLLAEQGLLGLLSFFAILMLFLVECYRSYRFNESLKAKTFALSAGIAVIACLFISVGEAVFSFPKINWLIGIIMGTFVVSLRLAREDAENPKDPLSGRFN